MTRRASTQDAVIFVLRLHGPMSAREVAEEAGITLSAAIGGIHRIRKTPGVIYIHSWRRQPAGTRGREIPVYALGSAQDAVALD